MRKSYVNEPRTYVNEGIAEYVNSMPRNKRARLRIGKRLACGFEGCVYDSPPYVVKVSDSDSDFEFANEFKKSPAKHVVYVYRVSMIEQDELAATLIYMERLDPLPSKLRKELKAIRWDEAIGSFTVEDTRAAVRYIESSLGTGLVSEDTVRQVLELADELRQRDMIYVDASFRNAMVDTHGTIKLIDFGGFDWR